MTSHYADRKLITLFAWNQIARDGMCALRALSFGIQKGLVSNKDVLKMCKFAVEATAEQDSEEIKVHPAYLKELHAASHRLYAWFQSAANRGHNTAISSLQTPRFGDWGSNLTMTHVIRWKVVKYLHDLRNPFIICAQRNLNQLDRYSAVTSFWLTSNIEKEYAAYGWYGTHDTGHQCEANALPIPVSFDVEQEDSDNIPRVKYMNLLDVLYLCAKYCPKKTPKIIRLTSGPHYETHYIEQHHWAESVAYFTKQEGDRFLDYKPNWKHIYHQVYSSGLHLEVE